MKEKLFSAFLASTEGGTTGTNHKAMRVNAVDFFPVLSTTRAELKAGDTLYGVNVHTGKLLLKYRYGWSSPHVLTKIIALLLCIRRHCFVLHVYV